MNEKKEEVKVPKYAVDFQRRENPTMEKSSYIVKTEKRVDIVLTK